MPPSSCVPQKLVSHTFVGYGGKYNKIHFYSYFVGERFKVGSNFRNFLSPAQTEIESSREGFFSSRTSVKLIRSAPDTEKKRKKRLTQFGAFSKKKERRGGEKCNFEPLNQPTNHPTEPVIFFFKAAQRLFVKNKPKTKQEREREKNRLFVSAAALLLLIGPNLNGARNWHFSWLLKAAPAAVKEKKTKIWSCLCKKKKRRKNRANFEKRE